MLAALPSAGPLVLELWDLSPLQTSALASLHPGLPKAQPSSHTSPLAPAPTPTPNHGGAPPRWAGLDSPPRTGTHRRVPLPHPWHHSYSVQPPVAPHPSALPPSILPLSEFGCRNLSVYLLSLPSLQPPPTQAVSCWRGEDLASWSFLHHQPRGTCHLPGPGLDLIYRLEVWCMESCGRGQGGCPSVRSAPSRNLEPLR